MSNEKVLIKTIYHEFLKQPFPVKRHSLIAFLYASRKDIKKTPSKYKKLIELAKHIALDTEIQLLKDNDIIPVVREKNRGS